jgi:hypothetical protein
MRVMAQLNRRERTAIIVCVGFIAATILLSFVDQFRVYRFARSLADPEYERLRYTGTIVVPTVPGQAQGQCRFTRFDNKTSELRGSEVANCFGGPAATSANDRINSLRDAFKR